MTLKDFFNEEVWDIGIANPRTQLGHTINA